MLLPVTDCHTVQRTKHTEVQPWVQVEFSFWLTHSHCHSWSCSPPPPHCHVHVLMQVGALEASPQAAEPAGVDKVLTGLEFDELAAVEKTEAVSIMSVFARVEPSHKSRLVELLQAQV